MYIGLHQVAQSDKGQGIVIATAAHGVTVEGMFWMMVIGRGVAGVGAGTCL